MAKSESREGGMAKLSQSQESHLLSPDISAAGSDNGHVEDLKAHSFSSLVEEAENHHHQHQTVVAKEAATNAAATTSLGQLQTSLNSKTPASLLASNPSTCSNTSTTSTGSKSKSKSKSDPSQTTRKPGMSSKSNNAKMGTTAKKTTLSTSRRPTPINVQIVRVDSPSPPSSSTSSSSTSHKTNSGVPASSSSSSSQHGPAAAAHSFVMNMLPMTKIRELCLHASAHARRHFDVVLDGSRFEARDRDGHVFKGHETISEEILNGETIYLVEGGLDARGSAEAAAVRSSSSSSSRSRAGTERPKSRSRERGRLLCLKSLELEGEGKEKEKEAKTPYRTPSVSSRASSSQGASKGKKSEPRMTASQKALAIAQMGHTPAAQKPVIQKKRPVSSAAVKKSLPSPALEKVGECSDGDEGPGDDTLVGEPDKIDDLERTLVAASPSLVHISTPPPSSPKQPPQQQHDHHQQIPPNLQDSQLVIPDSQDPFSQGLFSQQSVELQPPIPATSKPEMPGAPVSHSQESPRVKATATATQRKLPTSKPDPYDINTVLSDEEDEPSDESSSDRHTVKMAPLVRKLGSASAQRKIVVPPPVSLPSPRAAQLNPQSPSRAQSNPPSPSRVNRAGVPVVTGSKTSTPTKRATPIKADPSSPAAPLASSPTTHVAAAIAKGGQRRDKTPQLPSPGQMVIRVQSDSEEDDELIEEAFRQMSSSNDQPLSLPWSQPPLRAGPDGEAGADNQPRSRRGSMSGTAGEVRDGTPSAGVVPSTRSPLKKSPLRKALHPSPRKGSSQRSPVKCSAIITSPSRREDATIVHDSESEDQRDIGIVKKEETRSPGLSGHLMASPMKKKPPPPSPRKSSSQRSPVKSSPIITSPSKREEATVIQDASSAESEEEQDIRAVKNEEINEGLSPFLKTKLRDIPAIGESPRQEGKNQHEVIELSSGSESDYDLLEDILKEEEDDDEPEPELPFIDAELQGQEEAQAPPLPEIPETDPVKIEPACEEPPPSAQASKRKRDASPEPDPEEQNHRRKRAKRDARKARKERNRQHRAAMRLQEEREEQLAALEEERKKVALEKAHRRALELEIIVSSPVKREPSIDSSEEGDNDDSGVGSSPPTDDTSADAGPAGVPLDRDDKNDSLSSKEAEDQHPSWRKLSKVHLSSSAPKSSQNGHGEDSVDHLAAPPTSTPAIIEAQLQQCVEERFHRMPFDDWAFLEGTLGKGLGGGFGHSPLEVHNRVHLGMMHQSHPPTRVSAMKQSGNDAHDESLNEPSRPSPPADRAGADEATARAQSRRSVAPSPKEHREMEQEQGQTQEQKQETRKTRPRSRQKLEQERLRKKRARMVNGRYHHGFRPSRAGSQRKQRQKQRQNGH